MTLELPSRVSCDVPFDVPGKHWGTLKVPFPRDTSAWGALMVPIVTIRGGEGPTVLLVAGQHGDEYEGPVILGELCRELEPDQLSGAVILLPALNTSGLAVSRRLAPTDGRDFNRSFPGERTGTPTQALTHWIDTTLLDRVDLVLDLHSGGRSLLFLPSIMMHPVPDLQVRQQTRAALEAFGAPTALVIEELDLVGSLDEQVERRNTPFLFTELGGGARVDPRAIDIGRRGVRNLLGHLGVMGSEPPDGHEPSRVLDASRSECFVTSPEAGVLEPMVELGAEVSAGAPVARLYHVERPEAEPLVLEARISGIVASMRALALTEAGDTAMLVARLDR